MGMRPDLLRFQLMQQMQQQQQAQQQNPQALGAQPTQQQMQPMMPNLPPRNPIADGAGTGIEAARRSLQMNKDENSRALGRAMMHFFSGKNLPPPGSGIAGALGTVNASFLPAMQQYDAERDRIAKENFALMQQEEEMRRHAAKEAEQRAHFEEMKRLHDAQIEHYGALNEHYTASHNKLSKDEKEYDYASLKKQQLVEEGALPENAIMFGEILDKNERKMKQKEMFDSKEKLVPTEKNIKNIRMLKEIIKNKPGLWKSSGRFMEAIINKNDTQYKTFLSGLVNEEDIAAAQLIRKLTSDIVANAIKTFPGRSTDITKKIILNSMVNATTSPLAAEEILDSMEEENVRIAKNAKSSSLGWKYGAYIPVDSEETENKLSILDSSPGNQKNDAHRPLANMSKEELLQLRNNIKMQRGVAQQ